MSERETPSNVSIVIGASGAIGSAVVEQLLSDDQEQRVIAISRQPESTGSDAITWLQTDHSEQSIAGITQYLETQAVSIRRVVVCTGVLHGPDFQPEKMLERLDPGVMAQVFQVNVITPALWLSALAPLLKKSDAVIAVLSARVGSIEDNRSGGWYSYRASKAALNMILKSAAIELRRRAPGVKLLAFHPGTTDSALSKPFQRSVPPEKLFSPAFVAQRLTDLMDEVEHDGELEFVDWQGVAIPW